VAVRPLEQGEGESFATLLYYIPWHWMKVALNENLSSPPPLSSLPDFPVCFLLLSVSIGIRAGHPRPVSINQQAPSSFPATHHARIDDAQQQLQQTIDDLQSQIRSQAEQIQGQLAAQRETQERAHMQLQELITGLSMQVMQFTNRATDIGPPGGNNLSRLCRVDFPKFEGEDVQDWIYRCAQFFELDAIAANKKVTIAAIHLTGRAWYGTNRL